MTLPRSYHLVTSPMQTTAERKQWTLCYQRVVGAAFSEFRVAGGRRRIDVVASDGTKVEFQQARESEPNADGKSLMHASGVLWVFSVINQHFAGKFRITFVQGAQATVVWERAWKLVANCHGRIMLDLGKSPQLGAHVLLEIDHFEVDAAGRGHGSGILRDAQEFCKWMRDGIPLSPYYPAVAQSA